MTTSWLFATLCSTQSSYPRDCAMLVVVSYAWGVACSLTLTCSAVKLSFRGFNTINHFFCVFFLDFPLLFWFLSQPVASFHSSTFNEVITLLIILTSYMFIVVTTLKMRSAGGHRKAFSTCASRLSATSAFHSTILFLSCVPNSKTSRHTVKVASVFYTVGIPMLNPLIYSLRNRDVKDTVSKLMKAKLYSHWRHVTAKYLLWLLDKTFLILNELCVKNSFKKSL